MHRMRNDIKRLAISAFVLALVGATAPARSDLIRPHGFRSYPSIAGDMIGEQTYSYDPTSQTGVFRVTNAPHVITMGPAGGMVDVLPDVEGTLNETLQLTLDRQGRLIDLPENRFEVHGSVTIAGKVYEGLLLSARPTAFGAEAIGRKSKEDAGVFDLSLEVTGGKLAGAFGRSAYFRITPQAYSTFQGDFATDFSGGRPLTSLRSSRVESAPIPVPEPTLVLFIATCGGGWLASRLIRRSRRHQAASSSRTLSLSRLASTRTACQGPHSRSGGLAPSSSRGTRRSLSEFSAARR